MFVTNRRSVKLVQKREMLLQRADRAVFPRTQRRTQRQLELFAIEMSPHRQSARLQLSRKRKQLRVVRTGRAFFVEIGSRVETKANRMTK